MTERAARLAITAEDKATDVFNRAAQNIGKSLEQLNESGGSAKDLSDRLATLLDRMRDGSRISAEAARGLASFKKEAAGLATVVIGLVGNYQTLLDLLGKARGIGGAIGEQFRGSGQSWGPTIGGAATSGGQAALEGAAGGAGTAAAQQGIKYGARYAPQAAAALGPWILPGALAAGFGYATKKLLAEPLAENAEIRAREAGVAPNTPFNTEANRIFGQNQRFEQQQVKLDRLLNLYGDAQDEAGARNRRVREAGLKSFVPGLYESLSDRYEREYAFSQGENSDTYRSIRFGAGNISQEQLAGRAAARARGDEERLRQERESRAALGPALFEQRADESRRESAGLLDFWSRRTSREQRAFDALREDKFDIKSDAFKDWRGGQQGTTNLVEGRYRTTGSGQTELVNEVKESKKATQDGFKAMEKAAGDLMRVMQQLASKFPDFVQAGK